MVSGVDWHSIHSALARFVADHDVMKLALLEIEKTWSPAACENEALCDIAGDDDRHALIPDILVNSRCSVPKSSWIINQGIRRRSRAQAIFEIHEATKRRSHVVKTSLGGNFDMLVGFAICLNIVWLGISMDFRKDYVSVWTIPDVLFAVLFWTEACARLRLAGCQEYFSGGDRFFNIFDMFLVLLDTAQLLLDIGVSVRRLPSATLFRVVRIARIFRAIRFLKAPMLQSFFAIIRGLAGGAPTLGWAFVFLMSLHYVVALVCRETLGRSAGTEAWPYFNSVPRAFFYDFPLLLW